MLKIVIVCLLVMVPVAVGAMGQAPLHQTAGGGSGEGDLMGKAAPDFSLPTVSGEQKSMVQARAGKKAIIFFWATWCPHCHEALEAMIPQAEALKSKGVKVLLVDLGEDAGRVRSYLQANQVPWDSFVDQDNSLQEPYQLIGVPTLYFVDEHGMIRNKEYGFPSNYADMF